MYMPQSWQLRLVREHIAARPDQFRRIVESAAFRRAVGGLEGERLKRVPVGFPADHRAAEFLRFRQFIAGCEYPGTFAASPRFYGELLKVFRAVAPLTTFLNEPLLFAAREWPAVMMNGVQVAGV
jgi:uncharacterized protein (DUF2461 family)